jgi:hypothetical protein
MTVIYVDGVVGRWKGVSFSQVCVPGCVCRVTSRCCEGGLGLFLPQTRCRDRGSSGCVRILQLPISELSCLTYLMGNCSFCLVTS